ncbi:unnamed protein product [Calypogeia fissa]
MMASQDLWLEERYPIWKKIYAGYQYIQSESTTTFAFCEDKFCSTGGQFPKGNWKTGTGGQFPKGNWKTRHQRSTLEKIKLTVTILILKYWSNLGR